MLKCFSQGEPGPSVYWQYSANGKGELINLGDKIWHPTVVRVYMHFNA